MQSTLPFLFHVMQVVGIDILLSGDNAMVIALACRGLPPKQRRQGVFLGAGAAVVLRIALVAFSLHLLGLAGVKFCAGMLLVWIGLKLGSPSEDEAPDMKPTDKLWSAVKTIVAADLVMSFDNVAAIAGVADGAGNYRFLIIAIGLLVSIPLVVIGSQWVMKLMDRFPSIVLAGATLLGWLGGSMLADDSLVSPHLEGGDNFAISAVGAILVLTIALYRRASPLTIRIVK